MRYIYYPCLLPEYIPYEDWVHDGCMICSAFKGEGYKKNQEHLISWHGRKRICAACWEKMEKEQEKITTAFHEAGHAVMAYALGLKFNYVTIKRAQAGYGIFWGFEMPVYSKGHIRMRSPRTISKIKKVTRRNQAWVFKHLLISFSGVIAVNLMRKTFEIDTNHDDFSLYDELLAKEQIDAALFNILVRKSKMILKPRWSHVRDLALQLLEKGTVNYEDAIPNKI